MQTYKLIPGCCEKCTKRVRTDVGLVLVLLNLERYRADILDATERLIGDPS